MDYEVETDARDEICRHWRWRGCGPWAVDWHLWASASLWVSAEHWPRSSGRQSGADDSRQKTSMHSTICRIIFILFGELQYVAIFCFVSSSEWFSAVGWRQEEDRAYKKFYGWKTFWVPGLKWNVLKMWAGRTKKTKVESFVYLLFWIRVIIYSFV